MALTVPWSAPAKMEAAVTASVAVSAPQAGMGSIVRSQVRLARGCGRFPSPTLRGCWLLPHQWLGGPLAIGLTSWSSRTPWLRN